jgi:hypothetical protein
MIKNGEEVEVSSYNLEEDKGETTTLELDGEEAHLKY